MAILPYRGPTTKNAESAAVKVQVMHIEDTRIPDWNAVQDAANQTISASSDPFDPAVIANVHDLIEACRRICPVPDGAAKGYRSTMQFSWGNLEVEVFDDRYEFYRFKQGHTDIEYFSHAPGSIVPVELMNHLPKRLPEG
jgi:hypothetical protein